MSKKYSFDLKMKIVQEYLDGKGGYKYLASKYSLSSSTLLERWVAQYKKYGYKGLTRKREKQKYDLKFKLNAVQCYLSTEISYQELAMQLGISNPTVLCAWVNDYRKYGIEGISNKSKGQPPTMPKEKELSKAKCVETISSDAARIKELEQKVLHLEIENAFLKELRRLRLEEEAMKRSQELSAVSEENTD